ncbi:MULTISPECIES: amidase [unclassified Mesorhizobium]|uniref:amidase n=3 Tax=Mesorhizobium TaxID=68287 RepID=UPI000F75FE4C|nr:MULTISPECIES: amidase [unclassified Mesorhizobium]TGT63990.1 amidase [Mesorhizobium sp. M00.F.Ca.ET.170.01.1.1]AZO13123.1 amidase [Mesorhizobium sp. M3A.F.Ca.ET.080.04.2.1]RWB76842.1 MAG: amidase [Mesorhizobium sp.]RWB92634.1 MAG: amidase [Mesorhizobium sp.]RWE28105.1 MAG: amidase [Mesorhizobium sp.]
MQAARDRLEAILSRLADRVADEKVYMKLYREAASAAADAADARQKAGMSLGPLDGAIVSIKDLFDVAGEPTRAGSLMLAGAPPATRDATILRRLRQAGAVILGKTNMTEFAFTAIGDNLHYGTPGNAADASLIPGGSSSGAGVAVGEGSSDISIGSDTGGSVRIPASLNGVVGFKPTARRVPLAGAFPLSTTLDSIGPLARSVADCAIADAVMAGEEPAAPQPLPFAGLRIGIPRGMLFSDTQADVAAAFGTCVDRAGQAGARIADWSIDDLIVEMRAATKQASIAAIEGAEVHADWLATGASVPVDAHVSGPLSRALAVTASVYIRTIRRRTELVAAMDERLSGVDVLAFPTTPMVAPSIAVIASDEALRNRTEGLLLRNTQVANQFDLCAISLPMPGMRLPVGLMLVGRHGHDRQLLSIAAAVEALLGR